MFIFPTGGRKNMIKKMIRFSNSDQIIECCQSCQAFKSDIDIHSSKGFRTCIDAKSLLGMMSLNPGTSLHLLIDGEDEKAVAEKFLAYEVRA